MSVGEALAEARSRAGLSVDELSERTRIRTAVIQCIEQDDYDACGGDVFVRGYVRALAGAVGIDARPLIREYNRARVESPGEANVTHVARIANQFPPVPPADAPSPAAATVAGVAGAHQAADGHHAADGHRAADPEVTATDLPVVPAEPALPRVDPEVTATDLPFIAEDPAPTVADLPVIPAEQAPSSPSPQVPGTQTGWVPGGPAAAPAGPRPRHRNKRRTAWVVLPSVLALAAAGVAIGLVASSQSNPPARNAAAFSQHASHAAQSPSSAATPPSAPPTSASPTATPSSTPPTAPVTALPIAGAEAFGPAGLADGDNPQTAQGAVRAGSTSPWESQWYATAQFGDLKHGTGLLIDMGRTVTITSVRIDLAGYGGADLQLRVGNTATSPAGMRVAAQASGVGGTVRLHLSTPEHVRYLLIWFTLLPPNGAGQFQASVYHVVVDGYS